MLIILIKKVGYWEDIINQRNFFDWLYEQLNMTNLDDWYNFTCRDVNNHGGKYLMRHYYKDSLAKALEVIYPNTNGTAGNLSRFQSKCGILKLQLMNIWSGWVFNLV